MTVKPYAIYGPDLPKYLWKWFFPVSMFFLFSAQTVLCSAQTSSLSLENNSNQQLIEKLIGGKHGETFLAHREILSRGKNKEFVQGLEEVCKNGGRAGKLRAVQVLSEFKSLESAPVLINLADDSDPIVKITTINALGIIGNKKATGKLLDILNNSTDPNVQVAVIHALGQLGDTSLIPILKQEISSSNSLTQMHCALALARLGDFSAQNLVRNFLMAGRKDDIARWPAIQALGLIGQKGDLSLLSQIEKDPSESVVGRELAKISIYQIRSAGMTGGQKTSEIDALLRSDRPRVVQWAIHEMSEDGSKELFQKLESLSRDTKYSDFKPDALNSISLHNQNQNQ